MEAEMKNVTEYPLSSYQKDIWLEQCMYPGKPIYNIGGYTEIKGEINVPIFSQAIQVFINRNEMMRSNVTERDGVPYLNVLSESLYELPVHDFSGKENSREFCMEWMRREFQKPFDMGKQLFQFDLLKWSDNQYFVFIKAFHLIIDGWGFVLTHKQIIENYNELYREGKTEEKPVYSYHDFLLEDQSYHDSKSYIKDREFWRDKYLNIPEPLFNRNANGTNPDGQSDWSGRRVLKIDRELYNRIIQFSEERGCSVFHFVLGTLFTYFSRVCDKEEVVIGVPVLNRSKTKYKQTMGHFANVIPLRISPGSDISFQELVKYIKNELMDCYRHMRVSTGEIYRSVFSTSNEKSSLFDLSFSYEKHGATESFVDAEIGSHVMLPHHHERNALTVYLREYEDAEVYIDFSYRMDVFDKFIPIENVVSHFDFLFRQVLEYNESGISEIGIVPEWEQKKMTEEFHAAAADYSKNKTIHTLFEEQVLKYPEQAAVCLEDEKLSYRELNQRSNQLAWTLREKGVKKDQIIAIMTGRSFEMIIGMMGILKAGGAYLTIDPNYPSERIKYMLEDSASEILLTQKHLSDKADFNGEVILLDDSQSFHDNKDNPENRSNPGDLAYIIYTSGSTGRPKGVMVKHQGILNLQTFFVRKHEMNKNDRMLQFASNSFDASVWEIFTTLLTGATLYLIPKETINNLMEFEKYVNKNGITIALLPPTYLSNLEPGKLPTLTRLVTGGSAITKEMVKKWKDGLTYINAYGPTEYSVITTTWTYKEEEMEYESVPIGTPVNNTRIFILDKKRHILPIGAAGELCISGDGLARGYLNRPELTKEKFVDNPFEEGEKMYRTGDLARWLPDGNIEFLGRIDDQVKVRGFRIELGEIESQLLKLPQIKEAAAVARDDLQGNKYIAAYIVGEETLPSDRLRAELLQELPDYMVPSCFVQLDQMPLTVNGKIDRKALPEPDLTMDTGAEYEAPSDELEEGICRLWKKIFKAERVGINDNFFALGGDSLNAIVLSSEIHKEFNVNIPLKEIFAGPTVREMAEYLRNAKEDIYASIKPVEQAEYYPMSSAQKRVYVLGQLEDGKTVYNIPGAVLIEGSIDAQKTEAVFKKLIERHETLRTSFEMMNGEPVQRVHEQAEFSVSYREASEETTDNLLDEFIKPFDLSKAPLLRAGLVKTGENRHVLLFDMHHIISDGVSLEILIREFSTLYEGMELNPLRLQYRDYSAWQNQMYGDGTLKKQEEYWMKTFEGDIPVLNMPLNYQRPAVQSFEGDRVRFHLSQEISRKLQGVAKDNGATMYMVLLAAYNTLLYKYTGQEDIIVGSPIAGRPHADLQNIIGMFVNTLAMRNYPRGEKTFQEFLAEVREMALGAYENQDYPFEELVEKLKLKRDVSRNALFDAFFALQSVDTAAFAMNGLEMMPYSYDVKMSKFDIALTAKEEEAGIEFELAYCTRLFSKESMVKTAIHYGTLLEEIAADPQTRLKDLQMLEKGEIQKIVYGFNDNSAEYARDKTIIEVFEEQAEKNPDRVAVEFEESSLTYRELNARSNQLAGVLREIGAGTEKTIGIMTERSVEMIVGIMAVLKAGSAYLPIDPLYPEARIRYMLEDSGTEILLTQTEVLDKVQFSGKILDLKNESLYQGDAANIAPLNFPDDMAYVIYTSGTTGMPKGVIIEHRNVLNLTAGLNRHIYGKYDRNLKVALVAPYVFDASVKQIFPTLMLGHTLCIVPEEARLDGMSLLRYYKEHSVDVSDGTPAHIRFLENAMLDGADVLTVKHFIIGGEALGIETVKSFYDRITGEKPRITNVYGPTECCVDSTLFSIDYETAAGLNSIPIGVPLNNVQVYILGKDREVLPLGAAGELYISGDGVGRGYLNRMELTEQKFVENPFVPGSRMYRTGDLARWLPDGTIEFLGRIDYQVKIRGYRIELGEIENRLLTHESVREAAVIDREDGYGTKYLCAYIAGKEDLTTGELREFLLRDLPEYMVPSYFIQLEKLPLTFNGKLDRKALPEPEGRIDTGVEYEKPEGMVEEKLAKIWQEVLKIEKIGRMDNFFELGGHSLKATVLVSRIHKEFNINIPLKAIFAGPTIKEAAEYIKNAKVDIYASIKPVEKAEYYPMSSAQKRVYVLGQLEDSRTVYNMPGAVMIEGGVDGLKTETAFKKLIKRHETLRTSFEMMDGEPLQRVHDEADFCVSCKEAPGETTEDLLNEFIKPFDLSKAPLLRVELVKTGENSHVLLFDMHHIISDGVSMEILIREFIALYEETNLNPLRLQYRDYSAWQNQMYEDGTLKKQEDYWLKTFEGEIPVLNLPLDYKRPAVQSFEGDRIRFHLSQEVSQKLRGVARENGATMYMVLLAAYNTLLYKYTGQEDIIVGSPIAGRPHADLQNIIGMFVNTLAMRNYPQGEKTFEEFLAEVREMALGAYENQDYPFEELVEKLKLKRDVSRSALFDAFFALLNVDSASLVMDGLNITPYSYEVKMSKFDIALTAKEEEAGIEFELAYCTRLFRKESMEKAAIHYGALLEEIANDPQTRLKDLQMLEKEEIQRIVYGFNDNSAEYARDKTIIEVFEEQAEKNPDHVAVEFEESSLTYGELNARSNQLAGVLREKGAGADKTIGIMTERSVEMIVGIMAVLKAGSAYLPVDPLYPEARIRYMLEDSQTEILLTQTEFLDKVQFSGKILDLKNESLYQGEAGNIVPVNTPQDMAYVIYTSGTTGMPKGVMIEHRNVLNLTAGLNRHIYGKYERNLKVALVAPYVFDASVKQIFPTLMLGHTLCIVPEEARLDGMSLLRYYKEHSVDVSDGTPAHIRFLENAMLAGADVLTVKHFVIGGEALGIETVKSFYDRIAGEKPRITNVYGPTECCVDSTLFSIDYETVSGLNSIPIGVPLNNVQVYILGKDREVLPVGAAGELYISGDGVGRGYLNRMELTEQKFVENPFVPGSRMYRTGDLARWLPDGTVEFLGRIDYQVKIRGYRIELGEIENRLLTHESVREAAVIDREDGYGTKYLCAYIAGKEELTTGELRAYLLKDLPDYMVPSYFIRLEKLPLTFNGKLDRKALPEPEGRIDTGVEYEKPEGMVEEKLAEIWQEVLKAEKIGRMDNFFELGGHSLKATVLVSRIHKEFNINIPLKEIFAGPTIAEMKKFIENAKEDFYASIKPAEKAQYYPMSSAQKRVYVLSQLGGGGITYNMPSALRIEGNIDTERLQAAFSQLIERHETLRTSFKTIDGELVQWVDDHVDFTVGYEEATEEKGKEIVRNFVKPFDLSKAPLLRAGLVKLKNDIYILMFDMHHIISDGVSMEILLREFSALYEGKELKPLQFQYRDYTVWQNQMYGNGSLKQQENYWLETLGGEIPVLNMQTDFKRPAVQSFEGGRVRFHLCSEIAGKLGEIAKENGATMYMVLLAAYNTLLYRYTGQEDIIVGSPIAGRPHADLQNIIGMFVNTLAMRNYPQGEKTYKQFLAEVREMALGAYENQDYPFEEIVEKLGLKGDMSRNALFDTMFALQNMETGIFELAGLKAVPYGSGASISKFDITLAAIETQEGISFELEYGIKLYKKETMEALSEHFVNILKEVAENPEVKLKDIQILDEEERKKILYCFNRTVEPYPKNSTIHGAFEDQVRKAPDKAAVVFGESSLSYLELNKKANALAKILRNKGVGTDKIVAIMAERSLEMIVAMFGVLKAGGAYLPVDPSYPEDRIRYMLEDSGAAVVLTQRHLKEKAVTDSEVIFLDDQIGECGENPENLSSAGDLAYIIYTSGSTGKPKGVMVEHHGIINLRNYFKRYWKVDENERMLQFASSSFDASVWEIFTSLLGGGTLYLISKDTINNLNEFEAYVNEKGITIALLPPTYLAGIEPGKLHTLKKLVTGGSAITKTMASQWKDSVEYMNAYGPTEYSIITSAWKYREEEMCYGSVPIGRPVDNTRIYILDKSGNLLPAGAAGELCVAGDGIARGYLNRPELTAEKFTADPFMAGERMYHTGDLARWLPDGNIEYMGRIDDQVKIRGFRIELGEIEARLLQCPSVREAVVIAREDSHGDKYLVSYYTGEEELEAAKLREQMAEALPDYMVPSYFVQLDGMPVTANGKIDKKVLPEPEKGGSGEAEYIGPRNDTDAKIQKVWQEVLGIGQIGIDDNFFMLGGNSIKAIQTVSRLAMEFEIEINDIFKCLTIRVLSDHIRYSKDRLKNVLSAYKEAAVTAQSGISALDEGMEKRIIKYKTRIQKYKKMDLSEKADYKNILLAGSTGYLGIHILYQLLQNTGYKLYVPIRSKDDKEAWERLSKKLEYYFSADTQLKNSLADRVCAFSGDLAKDNMGLSQELYEVLADKIDVIINSAANVKHYGHYSELYDANVAGNERLIEFARTGKKKAYNLISTTSIGEGNIEGKARELFTEYDCDLGQNSENYYSQTKFEAEKMVVKAREEGVNANVFRVGNLVFDSATGIFQENITNNAFYAVIRSCINLGCFPETTEKNINFSFIDQVAKAVVLLFDRKKLQNETYHLYNSHTVSMSFVAGLINQAGVKINIIPPAEFVENLLKKYDDEDKTDDITQILVHTNMLSGSMEKTSFTLLNNKTDVILKAAGFEWSRLDCKKIKLMLEHCMKVGFINSFAKEREREQN